MSKRDYYEVLEVDRGVSEADLKKAYRKLAMECHPDRNPDDPAAEERFKEVSEAYAILSDGTKRSRYDQYGHAGLGGPSGGGHPGQDFGDLGNFGDLFGDLFGDIFGGAGGRGGSRRGRGQRGADLRYNLEITLDDVLDGVEVVSRLEDPLDEDARQVNIVRRNRAQRYKLVDLCDGDVGRIAGRPHAH